MNKSNPFALYDHPSRPVATAAVAAVIGTMVRFGFRDVVIEEEVDRMFRTLFLDVGGTDTASRDAVSDFIQKELASRE